MKKIKNKLFFVYSGIIYIFLAIIGLILSTVYLEPGVKSFVISKIAATGTGSPRIIEVVVDDYSLNEYAWPWSNGMYAELLDYFHTYAKPEVVGFDVLLPKINPMKKDDMDFINQIKKMDNLVTSFVPETNKPEEADIEYMKKFKKDYSLNVDTNFGDIVPYNYKVSRLQPIYDGVIANSASVKIDTDTWKNVIYSSINVIKVGDAYYPSLPFKMYLMLHGTNDIILDDFNVTVPKTGLKFPHHLALGGVVKTDIRYYPKKIIKSGEDYIETGFTHYFIPASKILNSYRHLKAGKPQADDIPPEVFKNSIVLIGIAVSGPSADVLRTPIDNRHAGVDIQATVLDNLENNYFLHNLGFGVQLLFILGLSILAFISILRFNFIKSIVSIIIFDIIFFIIASILAANGYVTSFINPISVQFVTLIFGYSFKFISENRSKEKIKLAMGKYLSQDIMKNVVSNIDDLKLGGKRAVVTVLFSDIRGFTSLSEKMSAEEVSMILNEYFSEMEPIITKYNGVINKFIGDAVMAIFGEPIQDINHPKNAVKCAYEMLKKVEYLREKWLHEGKPKIEIGVGINTGEVFIGNIGTETRMEYTVIGDTVNLASRIESYNKVYKTNLLVSNSTYNYIADIADVIKISEVQIRGKAKKMNIYEVLRIDKNK
jgi:adenylate cyclase